MHTYKGLQLRLQLRHFATAQGGDGRNGGRLGLLEAPRRAVGGGGLLNTRHGTRRHWGHDAEI